MSLCGVYLFKFVVLIFIVNQTQNWCCYFPFVILQINLNQSLSLIFFLGYLYYLITRNGRDKQGVPWERLNLTRYQLDCCPDICLLGKKMASILCWFSFFVGNLTKLQLSEFSVELICSHDLQCLTLISYSMNCLSLLKVSFLHATLGQLEPLLLR